MKIQERFLKYVSYWTTSEDGKDTIPSTERQFALADELAKELKELAAVDLRKVDINSLTDLRDIEIDTKAPVEKKLASFAKQTKNPYVNRIGDYVVKVCYQKEGSTIDEKMEEYIRRLAEIYV